MERKEFESSVVNFLSANGVDSGLQTVLTQRKMGHTNTTVATIVERIYSAVGPVSRTKLRQDLGIQEKSAAGEIYAAIFDRACSLGLVSRAKRGKGGTLALGKFGTNGTDYSSLRLSWGDTKAVLQGVPEMVAKLPAATEPAATEPAAKKQGKRS